MIIKERIQKADGSIRFRNYLKQQRLGKGGFAECFKVERMQDKKQYALKIIEKKKLQKPKAKQKMLSQINLHKSFKHKYICQLDRVFEDEQNVFMLLQICTNGNMFDLIRKRKRLTIPQTQYFIYQLIDSLCYLHNKQIIHRDIKLGNLLINHKMELKLADFGLATKLEYQGDRKHTVCGTPNYIAPEVIMSSMGLGVSGHSYEVDIWSTGVIMYLMLIGKAPFETTKIQKTYERISKGDFDFPDWFKEPKAKDLLKHMMVVDVSKRYTFQQVLSHEFMNPKQGIPKQIPVTCLLSAPKFQNKYEKIQCNEAKQSARNFSINTLRSQVDLSMDENFEGIPGFKRRQEKSKDIKGLLKTVFSSSNLSRSLQKLAVISRNTPTSQNKTSNNPFSSQSRQNIVSREKSLPNTAIQKKEGLKSVKLSSCPYILLFKKQITLTYLLNTGYVGIYEPGYKLLFNKNQNLFFEAIDDGELKRLKHEQTISNENIDNRRKYLKLYVENDLQCEPFINTNRIVYLKRTFQVKSENLILFKFSNNNVQMMQMESQRSLLITNEELILLRIVNGVQIERLVQSKQNYVQSKSKELISLYLKFKKINAQINNMKK